MDTSNVRSRVVTMMSFFAEDFLNCKSLALVERRKRGKCVSVFDVTVIDAESETLLLCSWLVVWFMCNIDRYATMLVSVSWVRFMTMRRAVTMVNTALSIALVNRMSLLAIAAVFTVTAVTMGMRLTIAVIFSTDVNRMSWLVVNTILRIEWFIVAEAMRMSLLSIAEILGMGFFAIAEVASVVRIAVIKTVKKIKTLRRLVKTIVLTGDERMTMFFLLQTLVLTVAVILGMDLLTIAMISNMMRFFTVAQVFSVNMLVKAKIFTVDFVDLLAVRSWALRMSRSWAPRMSSSVVAMRLFTVAVILSMDLLTVTVILGMDLLTVAVVNDMNLLSVAVIFTVSLLSINKMLSFCDLL